MLDQAVTLCLACSASLPPRKAIRGGPQLGGPGEGLFLTPCCRRPICPNCLLSNPRLARYNPCLHCLAGAEAVSPRSYSATFRPGMKQQVNIDGAVRDGDVFVLEDDDDEPDDIEDGEGSTASDSPAPDTPPPAYTDPHSLQSSPVAGSTEEISEPFCEDKTNVESVEPTAAPGPSKYYIKPSDTLVGIALRFSIDVALLCRLNNLPLSTLRTTPHLLHTRTFLILPPTARGAELASTSTSEDAEHSARRARERAQQRLQNLTKERDWRVAQAYVALADLDAAADNAASPSSTTAIGVDCTSEKTADRLRKRHAITDANSGESSLDARALDRYLDDDEWEEHERCEGRGVSVLAFPLLQTGVRSVKAAREQAQKTWWRWRS